MVKKFKKKIHDRFFMFFLGAALFIVFFALWYYTSTMLVYPPSEYEKTPPESLVEANIAFVEAEHQKLEDESSYSLAVSFNNPYYCDLIKDVSIKNKCLNDVSGELIVPAPDTRSEQDVEDESWYSLAIALNTIEHCENIINYDLKKSCLDFFG